MDPNTYAFVAYLNALRQKELGMLPPEVAFTPFNLSALRHTPKRREQMQNTRGAQNQALPAQVEAVA